MERVKRRSKFIKRSRQSALLKGIPRSLSSKKFGKSSYQVLTRTYVASSTVGSGSIILTGDLDAWLRYSNDWTNYKNSYAFYNVHYCVIEMVPLKSTSLYVRTGICYNPTVSGTLTDINQVPDHKYYSMFSFCGGRDKTLFKFPVAPSIAPPVKTDTAGTYWGYFKMFSDQYPAQTTDYIGLTIKFYCSFGMAQ